MTIRSAEFFWIECEHADCWDRQPHDTDEVSAYGDVASAEELAAACDWWIQSGAFRVPAKHWCPEHHHHCPGRSTWEDDRREGAREDCPDCALRVVP